MNTKQVLPKTMDTSGADERIRRFKELTGEKSNFMSYWQDLHGYFYVESPGHTRQSFAGTEMDTTQLYDSTTLEAPDVLASGFMNYLTPPSSKWFKLRAKDNALVDNKEVSNYLEGVTEELYHAFNKSNFYEQAFPSYKSSGVYGTSILLEEDDLEEDIRFYNLPLGQTCIVEDAKGRVVAYYLEFEYTAEQAVTRWGEEALSTEMRLEANSPNQNKKHKFLLYIGKRYVRDVTKTDKTNLPIQAQWIDVEGKRIIEESGYYEFPAMTHRFDKRPFIPWGFSPAMKALPFGRLLNAVAKTNLRSMMKHTDPPVAVPHNAFIMPFNSNPRAINYYKKAAMDSGKDIFAFANFGNPQAGMEAIEYYARQVKSLMYNDVFLAFENITKQMQNPEVQERINEKMSMLGPAVGRYMVEMLNPIVIRTIGILSRAGKLPPIPEALWENPSFEIDYVSLLAQAQKRSELNSLLGGLSLLSQVAQFVPEAVDKINPDKVVDKAWDILGSPMVVLRDDKEVEGIRGNRAEAMAQQQKMDMLTASADISKKAAEGDKALAEAGQASAGKRRFE